MSVFTYVLNNIANICHILFVSFPLPREKVGEGLVLAEHFSFVCLFVCLAYMLLCVYNRKHKVRVMLHVIAVGWKTKIVVLRNNRSFLNTHVGSCLLVCSIGMQLDMVFLLKMFILGLGNIWIWTPKPSAWFRFQQGNSLE